MLSRRDECRQKHQAVVQYMKPRGLEAVVLTRRPNFAWFTGGGLNHVGLFSDVGVASLLITPEKVTCLTNNIESHRIASEELEGLGIEVRDYHWWDVADARRVWAAELGNRPVAADEPLATFPKPPAALGPEFDELRYVLNEAEIQRYREAGLDVATALETACKQVRPGMTEHQLAGRIAAELNDREVRALVVLVANEERVCLHRHPIPTGAKFKKYGMAVAGGERHGLFVSVTRLFTFGPIDDDLRRRHDAVSAVDAAMNAATRPGVTFGEIFSITQKAYADGGFPDDWQLHHQGGSTGYRPRDVVAVPGCPDRVRANQAFAWNPSITGTKSEDTVIVLPDRTEFISQTGQWPMKEYTAGGQTWKRNEMLKV